MIKLKTSFEKFSDDIYTLVYFETSKYLSGVLGKENLGKEFDELHEDVVFRIIDKLYKNLNRNA